MDLVVRTLVGTNVTIFQDGFGVFPNILKSLTLLYRRLNTLTPVNSNQGTNQMIEFSDLRGNKYLVQCRWQMGKPTYIGISDLNGKHGSDEEVHAIIDHDSTGHVKRVEINENFPSIIGSLNFIHESRICKLWRSVYNCKNTRVTQGTATGVC